MRRVNLLARLELDVSDVQHVTRALVQQPDDLRVQLVNRLAMVGKVQGRGECRIQEEESNPLFAWQNLRHIKQIEPFCAQAIFQLLIFRP